MAEPSASEKPQIALGVELALVGLGGVIGTLSRYGIGGVVAGWSGINATEMSNPVATLIVNILGALALGALVASLRSMAEQDRIGTERAARLRLLLGSGVLGGFTTYSGFATLSSEMLMGGQAMGAIGYAGATVAVGLIASLVGLWLGSHRWVVRGASRNDS